MGSGGIVGDAGGVAGVLEAFDSAQVSDQGDGDCLPDIKELARERSSDYGTARRLIARHGRDLKWTKGQGWLVWDGKCWRARDGEVMKLAHLTAEHIFDEIKIIEDEGPWEGEAAEDFQKRLTARRSLALRSGDHGKITAMVKSAQPYLTIEDDALDQCIDRVNVGNGTLHLSGDHTRLKTPRRADLSTKLAAVEFLPKAAAANWQRFMTEVLPDQETRLFMQRRLGSCLSGDISDQAITILLGGGSNGKSVMIEVISRLLGDYAVQSPIETFMHDQHRSGAQASPDVARLAGARLVRTSEPEVGARLSESMTKRWTSGEPITARFLNKELFEFLPQGKLLMGVNIRPVIVGKDFGIRRRIQVVPFRQTFQKSVGFVDQFWSELPGILNWLIDGYWMWRESGLGDSSEIKKETAAYFAEMDPIGQFVEEACQRGNDFRVPHRVLMAAYERWCKQSGEDKKSDTAFGRRMTDMGFAKMKSHGTIRRAGLNVLPEWQVGAGPDTGD